MTFIEFRAGDVERLKTLHTAYKLEIGEDVPSDADFEALAAAIGAGRIRFFGCEDESMPVGCCSVTTGFSTFNYGQSGVFEDFYILPEYRHRGIARGLVAYAAGQSGVQSLTVGCADCDLEMYKALGFSIRLGNLLAYGF